MATKAKTAETPVAALTLEARLGAAVELFHAGKADAEKALQAVVVDAEAEGRLAVARAARNHLKALEARQEQKGEGVVDPILEATILVNSHESVKAIQVLEKAASTHGQEPRYHYLRALALAGEGENDAAAEAIRKAVELDRTVLYQFRIEPDLSALRAHPALASLELEG